MLESYKKIKPVINEAIRYYENINKNYFIPKKTLYLLSVSQGLFKNINGVFEEYYNKYLTLNAEKPTIKLPVNRSEFNKLITYSVFRIINTLQLKRRVADFEVISKLKDITKYLKEGIYKVEGTFLKNKRILKLDKNGKPVSTVLSALNDIEIDLPDDTYFIFSKDLKNNLLVTHYFNSEVKNKITKNLINQVANSITDEILNELTNIHNYKFDQIRKISMELSRETLDLICYRIILDYVLEGSEESMKTVVFSNLLIPGLIYTRSKI